MGPLAASAYLRVWRSPVRVQVGIGQSLSVCVAATGAGVTQIHGFSGNIFREDLGCWGHHRLRCACVERCRHQWLVKVVKLVLVCAHERIWQTNFTQERYMKDRLGRWAIYLRSLNQQFVSQLLVQKFRYFQGPSRPSHYWIVSHWGWDSLFPCEIRTKENVCTKAKKAITNPYHYLSDPLLSRRF